MALSLSSPAETKRFVKKGLCLLGCLALIGTTSCTPRKNEKNVRAQIPQESIACTLEIVPKKQAGQTLSHTKKEAREVTGRLNKRLHDWKMPESAVLQDDGTISVKIAVMKNRDSHETLKRKLISGSQLELLAVHPDNATLTTKDNPDVPGYKLFICEFSDDEGNKHAEKLFLSQTPVFNSDEIETATEDDLLTGVINVTLTSSGGEKMTRTTSAMRKGYDRIAIVVDGKVNSAPVIQDTLSRQFQISGMDGEGEYIAAMLNHPLGWKLRFIEEKTKDATKPREEEE